MTIETTGITLTEIYRSGGRSVSVEKYDDDGFTLEGGHRATGPPGPATHALFFVERRALRGLCEMGDLISSIAWYARFCVLFCSNSLTCAMQGQAGRLGAPPIKTTSE